jgi:hypothetical protein
MAGEHEQALPQEPVAAVAEQFDRFEYQQQGGCVTSEEAVRWTRLATCAVPVPMWQGRAQSRRRCGRGEPSLGADVAGASPVRAPLARFRVAFGKLRSVHIAGRTLLWRSAGSRG